MAFRVFRYCLLFLCLGFTALAQTSPPLRVSVVDKDTRQPLGWVYVNVFAASNRAPQQTELTNELGVAVVTPEQYPATIEVVALGYGSFTRELTTSPVNTEIKVVLTRQYNAINEVVVTGTSQPVKLKDALSLYQVIPRQMIDAQGAVTLADALRNKLNIKVNSDQILGAGINMQGMSGDKVKILVDGLPLNGRENGNIDLSQINLNNVDRIEIIQGPMSVTYGTDALGGVINVITKKNSQPWGINANAYYESVGKYNVDAAGTFRIKKRSQVSLGGGRNFFQGWRNIDNVLTYDQYSYQTHRELFFKPSELYFANAGYSYAAASGFKLNFASDYSYQNVINKGSLRSWDPFGAIAFDEYYHTTRSLNRLSLNGKLGKKGHWQSQNSYNIYYRTRNRYNKDMVTLQENLSATPGDQDTSRYDDITFRGSYNNNLGKLSYTAGYDINLENARSLKLDNNKGSIRDYAVYTNLSLPVFSSLTASLGVRATYNTIYDAPVTPSVNLLYNPSNKVQLRGSYARGFRAPTLKELHLEFIDQNHHIIGNTNLQAETSDNMQLSASYQAYEQQADYLQFLYTASFNDVRNGLALASLDPANPDNIDYTYANVVRQRNLINTLQADTRWHDLTFQLGYSLNHTFEQTGSYAAFNAHEITATMLYNWTRPGINFNAFYKYTSSQPNLQAGIDGTASFNGLLQPYHTIDASVEKMLFSKKLQIIVGVKNLLDVRTVGVTGGTGVSSAHSTNTGSVSSLPRSLFTSLRLSLN